MDVCSISIQKAFIECLLRSAIECLLRPAIELDAEEVQSSQDMSALGEFFLVGEAGK